MTGVQSEKRHIPLQDYVYKKWVKQGMQDGIFDQLQLVKAL